MARPKKRKFISKIQKLINKGVYKARPKGRPPKASEWNYKTGKYERSYPAALVKAANERLRKLEKVFGLSQSSEIYQLMTKYKTSYSKTKGKIYDQRPEYDDKVRFINKRMFDELSAEDKLYFIDRVNRFMESQTSTKSGIATARSQSYKTFMRRYGDKYPNLSEEQYAAFFSTYNYNIVGDSETHFRYSEWSKVLTHIAIDEAMTDKQMDEVMSYVRANDWVGLKNDNNLSRYLLRI